MFTCFAIGASVLSFLVSLFFLISILCWMSERVRLSGQVKWTQAQATGNLLASTVLLTLASGITVWLWQRACA